MSSKTSQAVLKLIQRRPRNVPSMARELDVRCRQIHGALTYIRKHHKVEKTLTRQVNDTDGYFEYYAPTGHAIDAVFEKSKFSGALYKTVFDILSSTDDDPDKWTIAELTEMLGVSNSQARTAITRIKMKGYIVSSSQSDSDNRLLEYWIDSNNQPEIKETTPKRATKKGRANINLINTLMSQGVSIDDCALLMSDKRQTPSPGFVYWQKRILHLIEIGEVRA